MDNIYGIYV